MEEARSVFSDEFATHYFDDGHAEKEERFILLGMSSLARLLIVVHCELGSGMVVRIISARRATGTEASRYREVES